MHGKTKQSFDTFLLRIVDGSLAGVIFLTPLLMGGRHAIGQLALTVFAVAAALAWGIRQSLHNDATWRSTAATPLVLIGLVLIVLQTVPLPCWLLARVAPNTAGILTQWSIDANAPGMFGCWPCISLTPAETLAGLVIFLDFAMMFFVASQRIRHVEDVERLLRWCALSAVVMATLGIVQLLAGNGKFFWFYEHPFSTAGGTAKGSFSNRNHFAHFLALGIGPLIWWLQDAMRRARGRAKGMDLSVGLLGVALGIVLFAGLLSLSRGGILAMTTAVIVCTAVCYRATSLGRRFVAVLAGSAVFIGVSLAIFGFDQVSNRVEDFSSGSIERLDQSAGRRTIWGTTLRAVPDHLLLGTGVGSFSEVFLTYLDAPLNGNSEPSHAENSYLQVLLETGVVGLGLVLAGIVLCASWCVRGIAASVPSRLRVCAAAISASLAASAVHALVDFVWYVPACMAIVVILAACAMRVPQMSLQDERRKVENRRTRTDFRFPNSSLLAAPARRSFSWPLAVVVVACAGTWMITDRVGPAVAQVYWDEYLVARHAAEAQDPMAPDAALADPKTQERWIASLDTVVQWQPAHVQAHLKLVETHRRLFDILQSKSENPMSLIQIGEAVFNEPQFRSRDALTAWLPNALGPHWVHLDLCLNHARKALTLCPLEGRGYVHVAELSFLWATDRTARHACIEQAMRVRPFDGDVFYAAGNEALLSGNESLWRDYLKRAFACGPQQQQRIMTDRVAAASQELLPDVINGLLQEFQPDLDGARFLYGICARRCTPAQLTPLIQYQVDQAERQASTMQGVKAAEVWLAAVALYNQLNDSDAALRCAQAAVEADSSSYNAHYHLGLCLLRQPQSVEAKPHFEWCLQRRPNDQELKGYLREILKRRLDDQHRAAKEQAESVTR
jgi:O-antigen ligase